MVINAIAIDDEAPALEVIRQFIKNVPFVRLEATFQDPNEGLNFIFSHQPDLVFLDIQMPGMSGLDLAKITQPLGKSIIFTTAHKEYALESYDLHALDYLLKPFSWERFLTSLNRAYQEIISRKGEETSVFIKDSYDWIRVKLAEIQYIKSDGNLLYIYLEQTTISTRMTLTEVLEILPSEYFMRIHKSYIVNLNAIAKLERHQVTIGQVTVPLAGSYRELLESRLLKR